jgi:hypothetical protein
MGQGAILREANGSASNSGCLIIEEDRAASSKILRDWIKVPLSLENMDCHRLKFLVIFTLNGLT